MAGLASVVALLFLLGHVTGNDVEERAADPLDHLTAVTTQLSAKLTELSADITAAQADYSTKSTQISALKDQVRLEGSQVKNLTNYVNSNVRLVDTADTAHRSTLTSLAGRVAIRESPVAFMARFLNDAVYANLTRVSGKWQYLKFDYVQFQKGGENYNKTTGEFTAPSSGVYAFFLMMQRNTPDASNCLEANIMKNHRITLVTISSCPSGYTSSSNMVVTYLSAGATVSVKTQHSEQVFGYIHTTFTGMKLL